MSRPFSRFGFRANPNPRPRRRAHELERLEDRWVPAGTPVALLPGYLNQQELQPIPNGLGSQQTEIALSGSLLATRDNLNQVIDFNKDGRPDIFTAGRSVFYFNNGSAAFPDTLTEGYILYGQADGAYDANNPTNTSPPYSAIPHAKLTAAVRFGVLDLNNDGWQDVMEMSVAPNPIADGLQPLVRLLLNDQHGNFTVARTYDVTAFASAQPLDLGNNFNWLLGDLVSADFGSQSKNPAPLLGTFVPFVRPPVAGENQLHVTTTAFSLVETDYAGSQPAALLATFPLRHVVNDGHSITPVVGDLNGDALLDVVVPDSDGVTVYFGDGAGAFPTSVFLATTHNQSAYTVKVVDLDNDGKLDIVTTPDYLSTLFQAVTPPNALYVTTWMNQGGAGVPTWTPLVSDLPETPSLFTLADINLDGHMDLVTSNRATFGTIIALGDGSGQFAFQRTFNALFDPLNGDSSARSFGGLGVQDINRDGLPDVVTQGFLMVSTSFSPDQNALLFGQAFNQTFAMPSVSSGVLPAAMRGQPYSQQLLFSGGDSTQPYKVSLDPATPMPGGLTLSQSGLVNGVPTQSGPFSLNVTVFQDNGLTGVTPVLLQVDSTALTITPASLPTGYTSQFYNQQLSASGASAIHFTVSSGMLPTDLSLSAAGLLSGIPSAVGSFSFAVTATDGLSNTGFQQYTVSIGDGNNWMNVEIAPPGAVDPGFTGDSRGDFVRDVYRLLLGRVAAPSEATNWSSFSESQIVAGVYGSLEHRLVQSRHFYVHLLGRQGTEQEIMVWAQRLQSGMSETEVSVAFLVSAEFQGKHASDAAFVESLYQVVLGRAGDPAGTSAHLSQLSAGVSRRDIAMNFLRSAELGTKVVNDYYQDYLERTADSASSSAWLASFVSGAQPDAAIARAFLTSTEFLAKGRPHP